MYQVHIKLFGMMGVAGCKRMPHPQLFGASSAMRPSSAGIQIISKCYIQPVVYLFDNRAWQL